MRKIVEGGVDDSYGIEVAKLAGLPKNVINRAKEILSEMEKEKAEGRKASADGQISFGALNDEEVLSRLRKPIPMNFPLRTQSCFAGDMRYAEIMRRVEKF